MRLTGIIRRHFWNHPSCGGTESTAACFRQKQSFGNAEPSLREMLEDPIVRMVMKRDGFSPEDVWGVLAAQKPKREIPTVGA